MQMIGPRGIHSTEDVAAEGPQWISELCDECLKSTKRVSPPSPLTCCKDGLCMGPEEHGDVQRPPCPAAAATQLLLLLLRPPQSIPRVPEGQLAVGSEVIPADGTTTLSVPSNGLHYHELVMGVVEDALPQPPLEDLNLSGGTELNHKQRHRSARVRR